VSNSELVGAVVHSIMVVYGLVLRAVRGQRLADLKRQTN
jgi:hypothetical protein